MHGRSNIQRRSRRCGSATAMHTGYVIDRRRAGRRVGKGARRCSIRRIVKGTDVTTAANEA